MLPQLTQQNKKRLFNQALPSPHASGLEENKVDKKTGKKIMPPKSLSKVKKPPVKIVPMEMNTVQQVALIEFFHTCSQSVEFSRLSDNALKLKYEEYKDIIIGLNTIPLEQVNLWRTR